MSNGQRDPERFAGKRALVTGGTGSFGQVVTRFLLDGGCDEVRVLSRDEAKQYSMRFAIPDPRLVFVLGDVRDRQSVDGAMGGIDFVFHAAALKQVPNCELFPEQAVLTNVIGSYNVISSAIQHEVGKVVCLSTDKAVFPVNAMGMTKGLMEKLVRANARSYRSRGTVVCCVRYGNVIWSRGSVIPLFVDQIREGRPLTVTVPQMTRFLLTLDDAVGLVDLAIDAGRPGDVLVMRSPACTIGTLALAIKALFDSDLPVAVVGARPGEKLHETLASAQEMRTAIDLGPALRVPMRTDDLVVPDRDLPLEEVGDFTSATTRQLDVSGVAALLRDIPQIKAELRQMRVAAL